MEVGVDQQAAYVLHSRPYRDTSLIVDYFTLEHGRLSAVVQGARRPRSKFKTTVQAFVPLQLAWRGRNDLKTITQAEPVASMLFLQGDSLLCGLYVNELLQRLLQPFDAHPQLYVYYQYVLNELLSGQDVEGALRTFEHRLLKELGVMPDLTDKLPEQLYIYDSENGFLPRASITDAQHSYAFWGRQLSAISSDDYEQPSAKAAGKKLMRLLIDQALEGKPLRSRKLFQKM